MKLLFINTIIILILLNNKTLSESFDLNWIKSGNTGAVLTINISKDGKSVISTSYDCTLKIWDSETGDLITRYNYPFSIMNANLSSKDNTLYISHFRSKEDHEDINDYSIKIIDLDNGIIVDSMNGHTKLINAMCIAPDNKRLITVSDDSTIVCWNIDNYDSIYSIKVNSEVQKVDISHDGKYFIALVGIQKIVIGDIQSGVLIDSIITSDYTNLYFGELKYSMDDKYITAATKLYSLNNDHYNDLFFWDVTNKDSMKVFRNKDAHGYSYSFSDNSDYLVFQKNIWNLNDNILAQRLTYEFDGWICSQTSEIHFLPNSENFIVATGCGNIGIWNARTGNQVKVLTNFSENISSICFTPDNRNVAVSVSNRLKYFNSLTGELIRNLRTDYDASNMEFSEGGKYLMMTSSAIILLYDPLTLERIKKFYGDYYWLSNDQLITYGLHGKFSHDNKLLAGGSEAGNIRIWDIESELLIDSIYTENPVNTIDFSSDDKLIAFGDFKGYIKIYNLESHSLLRSIETNSKIINKIKFYDNDKYIVSISNDNNIKIWDCVSGNLIHDLQSHTSEVKSFEIIPNYNFLVSLSVDGTIKVWNLNKMRLILTFPKYEGGYRDLAISNDCNYLCVTTNDASIIEWQIDFLLLNVEDDNNIECTLIYPNPATDYIEINLVAENFQPLQDIRIYNTLGKCVLSVEQMPPSVHKIDISNLPSGIYIMCFRQKDMVISKNFIISK
ncbi:T9SS type A sorting domain-containing protein [Bacteroidota bacterium]